MRKRSKTLFIITLIVLLMISFAVVTNCEEVILEETVVQDETASGDILSECDYQVQSNEEIESETDGIIDVNEKNEPVSSSFGDFIIRLYEVISALYKIFFGCFIFFIIIIIGKTYTFRFTKFSFGGFEIVLSNPDKQVKRNVKFFLDAKRSLFCFQREYDNIDDCFQSLYETYVFLREQLSQYEGVNEASKGSGSKREGNISKEKTDIYDNIQKMIADFNEQLSQYEEVDEASKESGSKGEEIISKKKMDIFDNIRKMIADFNEQLNQYEGGNGASKGSGSNGKGNKSKEKTDTYDNIRKMITDINEFLTKYQSDYRLYYEWQQKKMEEDKWYISFRELQREYDPDDKLVEAFEKFNETMVEDVKGFGIEYEDWMIQRVKDRGKYYFVPENGEGSYLTINPYKKSICQKDIKRFIEEQKEYMEIVKNNEKLDQYYDYLETLSEYIEDPNKDIAKSCEELEIDERKFRERCDDYRKRK